MNLYKKMAISLGGLVVFIPLVTLLSKKELTLITLSDTFFMFSLVFLIIGAGIAVLSSGFFDFFQKNMKNLIQARKKNEPKEYIPLSEIFQKKPIYWLLIGGLLFFMSVILALLS